jgi:hypothetical protein
MIGSLAVALALMGTPACGVPSVKVERIADPEVLGYVELWADGTPRDCVVHVDVRTSGATRCAIIVHEVGHLHGREHTSDRRDIMNEYLHPDAIPSACKPKRKLLRRGRGR